MSFSYLFAKALCILRVSTKELLITYCYSSREGHGDFRTFLPDSRPQPTPQRNRRPRLYVCFFWPSGQSHMEGGVQQCMEQKKTLLSSCGTMAQVTIETSREVAILHTHMCTYTCLVQPIPQHFLVVGTFSCSPNLKEALGAWAGTRESSQKVGWVLHSPSMGDGKV